MLDESFQKLLFQILNIVKAKHDLKDKSAAINRVVLDFGSDLLEPELRPEFIAEMDKLEKNKDDFIEYNSFEELQKDIKNA